MNEIEQFIQLVLNSRGINEQDKKELELELTDHLNSLKLDYIKNGYDEKEAIELCIKEFGEPNTLGNNLKRYLVSKNKVSILTLSNKINGLLLMCFIYLCTTLFYTLVLNKTLTGLYYLLVTFTTISGIYVYVNLKLYDNSAKIKYFSFYLISFFLIERSLVFLFYIFSNYLRGGNLGLVPILNLSYLAFYILFSVFALVLLKIDTNNTFNKVRNPYNSQIKIVILFVISMGLNALYYLFPNRWYPLFVLVEKLLGKPINEVNRNIFYLVINNKYIVPNFGLLIFIALVLLIIYKILKKGIRSLI